MLSKQDKHGIALIGGVLLIAGLLVLIKFMNDGSRQPDAENCLGEPSASTVLVVDRSEEITKQTLDEIRARAMAYVRDSIRENERVAVFTVDDISPTALRPIISLCRPKRDGNRLIENVKSIERRYRDNYERPLDSAIASVGGSASASPLAQAFTDLALSRYLRSQRNTLVVFSDMLENTGRFSLYRCTEPENVIRDYRASRVGAQERPTFRNTMVKLNIVPRLDQSTASMRCRDKLWPWFFGDNKGTNAGLNIDYLPGGPAIPSGGRRAGL